MDNHSQVKVAIFSFVGSGFVNENSKVTNRVWVNRQIKILTFLVRNSALNIVVAPGHVSGQIAGYNLLSLVNFEV